MRVQRKIFHLLADNGISGANFGYLPQISSRHKFDFSKAFVITDKIDGTTVQADNRAIYQRRDKFKSGDPRKFSASEAERYFLVELNKNGSENKWIFEAVEPFQSKMKQMLDDLVVYFECFGSKIQDRYRAFGHHSIRIFDFALHDDYLPFEETLQKCTSFNLPNVGYDLRHFDDIFELLASFKNAEHIDPELKPFILEGWVIRQGDQIAKIRKADLRKLSIPTNP